MTLTTANDETIDFGYFIKPSGGTTNVVVTKTADAATITAGQTAGFTVTITNTGTATATGLTLSDPLRARRGSQLDDRLANPASPPDRFPDHRLGGQPDAGADDRRGSTLAAGMSESVHITSPTTSSDAGMGNFNMNSFDTTGMAAANITLGAAKNFTVLSVNNGAGNLIISSASIGGNVGVGPNDTASDLEKATVGGSVFVDPTAAVSFHAKDFIPIGGFVTQNLSQAMTAATRSSSVAGLDARRPLGNVTTNQTINAATSPHTTGVTVVNISSLSYNSNTLTLHGGPNDVFIINDSGDFLFADQIVLTGGLTADHVLFNLTGTNAGGHHVSIHKSTSVFDGTLLAPFRNVSFENPAIWSGEVIGGETLKIYSGAIFPSSLLNTATVTASNVSVSAQSSATITVLTSSGAPQLAADSSSMPASV